MPRLVQVVVVVVVVFVLARAVHIVAADAVILALLIGLASLLFRRRPVAVTQGNTLTASGADNVNTTPRATRQTTTRTPGTAAQTALIGTGVTIYLLWRLFLFLLVIAVIAGWIWGGSTDAHLACAAHDLGEPGLKGTLACIFEH